MDLPRQSKPVKGTKPLLSNLPDSPLTSNSPSGHGHAVRQKKGPSVPTFPLPVERTNHAGVVISKIEDIFESIADCMLGEKKELSIQLKSRRGRAEITRENQDEDQASDETAAKKKRLKDPFRSITFPSKSPQEAWKFSWYPYFLWASCLANIWSAALLRILELSHEALVLGMVITKRFLSLSCITCSLVPEVPHVHDLL